MAEQFQISARCRQQIVGPELVPALGRYAIEQAGICHAEQQFTVYRSAPSLHMLLYTLSGTGRVELAERDVELNADSLMIVPAGEQHRLSLAASHWQLCWCLLRPGANWPMLDGVASRVDTSSVNALLHNSIDSLFLGHGLTAIQRQSLQPQLVDTLQQLLLISVDSDSQPSSAALRLTALFNEVGQQLQRPWDIAALAACAHWSQAHLHRQCQRYYDCSPMHYLLRLRIERARQMLATSHWPITDIAAAVGYNNPANFSSRFRKEVGVTPRAYRQAAEQGDCAKRSG